MITYCNSFYGVFLSRGYQSCFSCSSGMSYLSEGLSLADRKKITRRLESIEYDSIETLLKRIDSIILGYPELSYKDFFIESYEDYGGEHPCLEYMTDETDVEMELRLEYEASVRKANEDRDRVAYEQLKKRFG